tara:strand:- start:499 stop:1095 length:597 start_codon:yes stop_codon:yes gene_type:complete
MNNKDEALTISNPRLIAAVYFGLLAVIANIVIDTILYAIGVQELLPFFQAIFLAVVVAALFGALFGEAIIHQEKPYKTRVFWLGFLMVIAAIPVHTFGFLFFFESNNSYWFTESSLIYYAKMYLLVLFYGFILFGVWLAIFAGIAAIYLRGHLVYHITNALYVRRRQPGSGEQSVGDPTPRHGQPTIMTEENAEKHET